jgi:K(+)-stimulated pyrophosphate-energized sodium pump
VAALLGLLLPTFAGAQEHAGGGEASLTLPDLSSVNFIFGLNGHALLMIGLLFCAAGLLFGLVIYVQLKNLPVHRSMREISELIYETCKTYLVTQGKFILLLWAFHRGHYLAVLRLAGAGGKCCGYAAHHFGFSLVGIAGSYGVAWFGIRVNTFANSRTAFAGLRGKPYPCFAIPLKAGMSVGMMLISVELLIMLFILLFIPADYAGPCFIGFAIGESLGAAALRIAGGIFTKIADIGSDLMKIVFKIKEDDARNPGVIADCTGDNAGDSVGPSADGFETYGVTGVALITFILLAVKSPRRRCNCWSGSSSCAWPCWSPARRLLPQWRNRQGEIRELRRNGLRGAVDLAGLDHLHRFHRLTYIVSYLMIPTLGDGTLWWKLASIISCGTLAGALIPELVKVFTSTNSAHVQEVVTSAKEGGASLGILSGSWPAICRPTGWD